MPSRKRNVGAVQSKATKLVVFARFRLDPGHTPRSKGCLSLPGRFGLFSVPLEPNFKALSPVALPCSGQYAGATDQRPDGALRLQWLSCARRRSRVNLWPAQPNAFAPADTAAGSAPCARHTPPTPRVPADYRAWSNCLARA